VLAQGGRCDISLGSSPSGYICCNSRASAQSMRNENFSPRKELRRIQRNQVWLFRLHRKVPAADYSSLVVASAGR